MVCCMLLSTAAFAQQSTLTGTVTDMAGTPLAGVNVIQKGTTNGTVTDVEGHFTLIVPPHATVVFTYIGFSGEEIAWDGTTPMKVVMREDTELLDELVVVGYGLQKKVNLTGAITVIDAEAIANRPLTNASQALQGISGVYVNQMGGNPGYDEGTIRIRGIGTIGGGSKLSPLVMVDGVENDLRDINPNDIATISVLKDGASTAIYGSRAANGVILITTKTGDKERTVIEYTGYIGVQTPTYLPDPVDDSATFMEWYNKAMINQGGVAYYSQELIDEFRNSPTSLLHPNTNWMEVMFGNALIQEHNIRLSATSGKTDFSLSAGYMDQEGVLKEMTGARKYSLNLRVLNRVNDRLAIDAAVMASRWDADKPSEGLGTVMNRINRMVPMQPVGRMENGDWPDSRVLTPGQNSFQNPLVVREDHYGEEQTNRIIANLLATLQITDKLQYQARGSVNYYNRISKYFAPVTFLHDVQTGAPTRNPWTTTGYKNENMDNNQRLNFTHTLRFAANPGSHHEVSLLAGHSMEQYIAASNQARMTGYLSKDLDELNVGTMDPSASGTSIEDALISWFGRLQYNYRERYLLELNARYDGSSRFARENRWGLFPSFSAGWRIAEEPFMDRVRWIDELKLRASWGQIGNQEIGRFQYVNAVSFGYGYPFGGNYDGGGVAITQYRDPRIKWETTTMTNVGLDWVILENLLSGELELFRKRTDDILRSISIPSQVGALAGPTTNIAVVDNTGFEISLNHHKRFRNFSYEIGAHLTKVKNEVVDLKGVTYYSGSRITKEGYPIESWYVYETDGLFRTQEELDSYPHITKRVGLGDVKYVDRNNDKVINGDDRYIAGNTFPEYTYGFNIGFTYRNFSLTSLWQGVQHIDTWLSGNTILPFNNGAGLTMRWLTDSWTPENPNAKLPRITTRHQYTAENFSPSDFWLADASYLRMKNIQLTYTLTHERFLHRIGAEKLRLFLNAENLLTFTKMTDFDPEQDVAVENLDKYPSVRMITAGLHIQF